MKVARLDMAKVKEHTTILIVGKRRTGKSVLLRDLLFHLRRAFDFGVAFSPTEASREMFAQFMPRPCIYDQFDCGVVERMLEFQRSQDGTDKDRRQSLFCVLDDCLFDRKALKGRAMADLFMNGRHQKITLILVAQDVMALGPELRGNVDYCFCFKDNVLTNRRKLYEHFFGVCGSFDRFSTLMNATTDERKTMVLDATGDSNAVEESVFWYRATLAPPKFYLCRRSFWRLSLQYGVPPGTKRTSRAGVQLVGGTPVAAEPAAVTRQATKAAAKPAKHQANVDQPSKQHSVAADHRAGSVEQPTMQHRVVAAA